MTNLAALKKLAAAVVGNGVTADEIPGQTTAEVIEYLAKVEAGEIIGTLTVKSVAGATAGTTKITVTPAKASGNSYVYKTNPSAITKPEYLDTASDYTSWDGTSDIEAEDGHYIAICEVNSKNQILNFGQTPAKVNLG